MYCPKCKEYIGDQFTTCPLCKHVITMGEVLEMEKEKEKEDARIEQEAIVEFAERRHSRAKILSFYGIYLLVVAVIVVNLELTTFWYVILVLPGGIFAWAKSMSAKADMCPYCDTYIYRRGYTMFNTNCPNCGRKVR